ncbi:MAG: 2-C-methyl-D-erythritol 4-phosphate cytidylyltransferase [Mariprofundaceae bacterium]|nr:2-C-methyl-D-erythritol 4-phosphate cytidylyltransferase [Mariprofundaceae bacterium]
MTRRGDAPQSGVMQVTVLFLAAGNGKRFGGEVPKQYQCVNYIPLVVIALNSLAKESRICAVQPVLAENDGYFTLCLENKSFPFDVLPPVAGGPERAISMANGMDALSSDVEWVAVQDAARPVPSPVLLTRVLDAAQEHGAAVPGIPVHDTVKRVDKEGRVLQTLDRHGLRAVQTPQVARREWFDMAIASERERMHRHTDDASMLEAAGFPVFISPGDVNNRKITTPEDMTWLQRYMEVRK